MERTFCLLSSEHILCPWIDSLLLPMEQWIGWLIGEVERKEDADSKEDAIDERKGALTEDLPVGATGRILDLVPLPTLAQRFDLAIGKTDDGLCHVTAPSDCAAAAQDGHDSI